jgi:hypothetical protein
LSRAHRVCPNLLLREFVVECFFCRRAIPVGFAGRCLTCQSMPARLDSEFCSEACRRARAASSSTTTGYPQPTGVVPVQPAVLPPPQWQPTPEPPVHSYVRESAVQPAPAKVSNKRPRKIEYSVPEGFGLTCQSCRRSMKEPRGHYCSKECEEASRKSSRSSRS